MIAARQMFLGKGGGAKLPYDAEVEYLESTGTQWIDTDISGAEQNLIITTSLRINTFSEYAGGFGNYVSEAANCFRLILTGSDNGNAYANCGYKSSSSHIINAFSLGDWHTVVFNGEEDRCFCDGVEYTKGNRYVQGTANTNTIKLFTSGGAPSGTWSKQISSFKVELNGVLIRDFIPVRFTNELGQSEGAMYDRVSGQLFRNQGTGDFRYGDDVVEVEYLESTGTQWIDTGITPQLQGIYKIDFKPTVNSPVPWGCLNFTEVSNYGRYFRGEGVAGSANRRQGVRYVVELNGATKQYIINGVVSSFSNSFFLGAASGSCWLFGRSDTGALGQLEIYSASFTDSAGVLVRNFVPVRIGTEGALKDTLTRRFYRNAGTGNFSYGADKAP